MSEGVQIWRCAKCRTGLFPQPLLCPRCHGHEFTTDQVRDGVIEEISVIRHMLGQENWQPRRIASVRTSDGQLITVGVRDELGPSTRVELFQDGEAPFGRAKT